jgi:transcription elongation factor Elf1
MLPEVFECPQCQRQFVVELVENAGDQAVYSMTDCDAELKTYGNEIHKVVNILRKTLADLDALKSTYR